MIDPALIFAFLGACATGGLLTQMWQTVFGRKKEKLDATETLEKLSAAFREEVRRENNDLRLRMQAVVDAVVGLTDTLDDFFPRITGLTDEERLTLRQRINLAKRLT